jgi:hypothetical protein
LLDDWARAGYPTAAASSDPAADPKTRLFDRVLCPTAASARGFGTRRARNCYPAFYAMTVTASEARTRLLAKLATTPDRTLFRQVALNLLNLASPQLDYPKPPAIAAVLELWKKLEPDAEKFRELARLLAIEIDYSYDLREALYDQTTRYYRARAADRGVLLFLLARIDGYGRTPVNWKNFAEIYGAPITDRELAVYLDQSYLAFQEFQGIADALSGSPGSILAPKIRTLLDEPLLREEPRGHTMVLGAIAGALDRRGDLAGLRALRAELARYVGTDPARERTYRDVLGSLQARIDARAASDAKRRPARD